MRDISKIIKLRVFLALLGLLVILWSVLCVSSIRTNLGLKNPKEVTGKESPNIKPGNVVSIEYDYLFDGRFISGYVLGRDHYYEIIKLSNKEEFLYCKFIGETEAFLEDLPFCRLYREIKENDTEENYLFVGKVRRTDKSTKKFLTRKYASPVEGVYKFPNTLTDTKFDYYIQYIEPEEERNRMLGRITFWVILTVSWLLLLKITCQEQRAYLFYLDRERTNRKTEYRIALEQQIKESKAKNVYERDE